MPYASLPVARTADGSIRGVGLEFEFIGPDVGRTVSALREALGGEAEGGPHSQYLRDSSIGDIKVLLDMGFVQREGPDPDLQRVVGEIGGVLVPVEIVLPPLPHDELDQIDPALEALRAAGAQGTSGAALYAFGMHINTEVVSLEIADIYPVLRAFALIEDGIRDSHPIDLGRWMLPFVDPYPRGFIDAMARGEGRNNPDDLIDVYTQHNATRNRGLDMLPILRAIDAERVQARLPAGEKGGTRPTFHYRLPDCRIDEPGWSPAVEWNVWTTVERIASDAALIDALAQGWLAHRARWTTLRTDWPPRIDAILREGGYAELKEMMAA
ncbi:amidoligase family protein [Pontivivens ytuae]|uniref:Amidoligase family protein n=1 Tax=Pontivivens ytuae TaxID=2789856 RepID=A0A7S9QBH8_9RHOB|nr:amidoligase family protein [Pontivivens ytuae]QPH52342.1 amidoligase family protein [Pontivivens ytuae]